MEPGQFRRDLEYGQLGAERGKFGDIKIRGNTLFFETQINDERDLDLIKIVLKRITDSMGTD